jgi:hypothetical protein
MTKFLKINIFVNLLANKESFNYYKVNFIYFYFVFSLYKKLEKELHEKRKEMANIIETANTAYEERDKANDSI